MLERIKFFENRTRRIALVFSVLGSSAMVMSGCDVNSSNAVQGTCAIYDTFGQQMKPSSYPLVQTTVKFKQADGLFNDASSFKQEEVEVTKINNNFSLEIHDFPNVLGNFSDQTQPNWPNTVAVQVNMPSEGILGITRGCVSRGYDQSGFPIGIVKLPTYISK